MKFRRRSDPQVIGFQIAPIVDVLLVLLCFFIVTWSFAKKEMDLDVKVPAADKGQESKPVMNQTVLNVKADGAVVWNRKIVERDELLSRLQTLVKNAPDYSIILRGDGTASYQSIIRVLDTCRDAGIWNVAFATIDKAQVQ
jgi:biopolymer transport protein ExbD